MDNYSFFLFSKLYECVNGISEEPYDLLFGEILTAYEQYDTSEYNTSDKPEYECMLNFLKSNNTNQ
jgi:hypothetical protein